MMKVVGEEGTSLDDYVVYLKGNFLDSVYFQQNSFDPVDAAVSPERQKHVFSRIISVLASDYSFPGKDEARSFFNRLRQRFIDWNGAEWMTEDFKKAEAEIADFAAQGVKGLAEDGKAMLERMGA